MQARLGTILGIGQRLGGARRRSGRLLGLGLLTAMGVAVLALLVHGRAGHGASGLALERSLAIIPFATLAGDTRAAYLGEGIADGVTNELKHVGTRLAGSNSAARFVGKSARDAGKALGFPLVLDGRVASFGKDSMRVTAQLTRVSDGQFAWQGSYAAAATGIGDVQDAIARAIAPQLQVRLAAGGSERARGTKDAMAYDLFIKGLYQYRRLNRVGEAIDAFDQATVQDRKFARAWAALAQAFMVEPNYDDVRISTVLPLARDAAEHAVRLDRMLADGHVALGQAHAEAFEWPKAEDELHRAISLDSTAAEPRYRLGVTLLVQGKADEAIQPLKAAVALDPFFFIARAYLGWAELQVGRIREGLDEQLRSLALEPNSLASLSFLASSYARIGKRDSAQLFARRMLHGTSGIHRANLGRAADVLARSGAADQARAITDSLERLPADSWMRWAALTLAYAGLGDSVKMIDAMEHAAAGDGDELPAFIPRLAGELPSGPRVDAVLRRYNLDPARLAKQRGGR